MAQPPCTVRDDIELAAALKRADELLDRTGNPEDDRELADLVAAIDAYTGTMPVQRGVSGNSKETGPNEAAANRRG